MADDLRRMAAEKAVGGKTRLEDFDGVGRETLSNLRRKGFRGLGDIQDATTEELTQVEGIGDQRARSLKQQAPRDTSRSRNTGSVSAAGIRVPVGEFKVDFADKDKAEAKMSSSLNRGIGRSRQAAQSDKGKRAPVTTDYDEWKANKGSLDFPGVDTPSEEPEFMQQDRRFNSPDDTTLDQREGSLFVRENRTSGGTITSLKGVLPGSRTPGADVRESAGAVAMEDIGADINVPSGGSAVADVTFLEREKDGFGEELIAFEAVESDKNSFDF